jgi:prepilin signal peptidase PulO-like enzyme (type II secretory pathway)
MPAIIEKMLFTVFSLCIAAADIKTGAVPRIAFIAAFLFFLAFSVMTKGHFALPTAIAGTVLGLAVFLPAYFITRRKLGLADVWYSALTGLVLGPLYWFFATGVACFTGIVFIAVSGRRRIPFIPCMAIGGVSMAFVKGLSL